MEAIETKYNGYRFRSRLEARWAVFFDALGVGYEYEPEGYDIGGQWYLPDFYIPSLDVFLEIKPLGLNEYIMDKAEMTCRKFRDETNQGIIMRFGSPSDSVYSRFYGFSYETEEGTGNFDAHSFFCLDDNLNLHIAIQFHDPVFSRGYICTRPHQKNERVGQVFFEDAKDQNYPLGWGTTCMYFEEARIRSRQARFEHGEKG